MASGVFGVALQLLGTAALIASGPATGGLSWALLGAGVAAIGAGTALAAQAAEPEPISRVSRQLATTSDAESPWEWVYGEVIKGGTITWQGVGGDDSIYSGVDFIVACHPCEELLGIQIGEWYFPIVTDPDGTSTANGRGLILNAGPLSDGFPTDWYVPVASSPWWRSPQDITTDVDRAHIGVKWYSGGRSVSDPHMVTRFGSKYSNRVRKYTGHTSVSIITRVNDTLGTGTWEQVLFHLRGKDDIRDHTDANPAYRNNAAYVFADICREWLNIPVTDIVGVNPSQTLQGVASECDNTTWAGASGSPRYDFNGVIRDDVEPTEALQMICEHMCGGYSERGDKVALFTGTVKTAWSDGPLTYDDVVAVGDQLGITIMPPDEDSWANTLVPHFVVMRPNNEDGENQLYGRMEPARHDVSSATYITEDDGDVLRQDIKFPACIRGRQAKDRAWTVLRQMRLGASMEVVCKKRASVLEKGDVVAVQFPDFVPNNTKFQITSKQMILGPDTFGVRLGMVRYEDAIYDHSLNPPSEDSIGVVPKNRSSIIPNVTGLAAEVIDAHVQPDGDIVCDVSVTWTLVTNILVRGAGDIRIAWKRQVDSRWRATTVPGDDIETVISGLRQSTPYHIRARAEGVATAGRGGRPKGKWTSNLSFTPESDFNFLAGPPGTLELGENLCPNWNFEAGKVGRFPGWEAQVTAPGTFTVLDTGGKYGPRRAHVAFNGSTATQRFRMNTGTGGGVGGLIPVEVGQRYRIVIWLNDNGTIVDDTHSVDFLGNVQFYGGGGKDDPEGTVTAMTRAWLFTDSGWIRVRGTLTVPTTNNRAIAFMRFQPSFDPLFGSMSGVTFSVDGVRIRRVLAGTSTILDDVTTINNADDGSGQTWTTVRSVTGATPGSPVKITCQFQGRVGDAGAATINPLQLQARILRIGPDPLTTETVVKDATDLGPPTDPESGSGTANWGPWGSYVVQHVDDSAPSGEYIYRCEFRASNNNARSAVKNRGISWELED